MKILPNQARLKRSKCEEMQSARSERFTTTSTSTYGHFPIDNHEHDQEYGDGNLE
jgi:hypothetical protein